MYLSQHGETMRGAFYTAVLAVSYIEWFYFSYDCNYPIMFPKRDVVIAYSETVEQQSPEVMERLSRDFERLRATAEKDPMYEMHEQEKKDIWAAR